MNTSGILPKGNRVLIKPDQLEETTAGGIVIPETDRDRHQLAQITGTLIDVGPDAWMHETEETYRLIDGEYRLMEIKRVGYSEPFAAVGDRVSFARYGGHPATGADGEEYRLLNDKDITTVVSEEVEFTEFKSRKGL